VVGEKGLRLAASLTAALLESLFEHPGVIPVLTPNRTFQPSCSQQMLVS
jgi:hypothetical protein